MNPTATKFFNALPSIKDWIDQTLQAHATGAIPVSTVASQLQQYFPSELFSRARVVVVPRVPFPNLSEMGLTELKELETLDLHGVTYIDTFFVKKGMERKPLFFHEMVHVVQWERLGVDRFLMAYGLGIVQNGYANSEVERMAYRAQEMYEADAVPTNLTDLIEQHADAIWGAVQQLLEA